MDYSIRPFQVRDVPFLWEMLYQSIYVPERHQAPSREILKEQSIAKYLEDWGGDHDYAFIAVDGGNHPVGAIWMRIFNYGNTGYGLIDDIIPELGMAIMPEHRGHGIGKHLLSKIIEFARSHGYPALSLSFDPINKVALQLYEKSGFEKVDQDDGGSWTMKIEL